MELILFFFQKYTINFLYVERIFFARSRSISSHVAMYTCTLADNPLKWKEQITIMRILLCTFCSHDMAENLLFRVETWRNLRHISVCLFKSLSSHKAERWNKHRLLPFIRPLSTGFFWRAFQNSWWMTNILLTMWITDYTFSLVVKCTTNMDGLSKRPGRPLTWCGWLSWLFDQNKTQRLPKSANTTNPMQKSVLCDPLFTVGLGSKVKHFPFASISVSKRRPLQNCSPFL